MILVVEDEILIRRAVAEYLRISGYLVVEAANAAEAISVLAAEVPIDVVFSDIHVPGTMNGLGLARWVLHHCPDTHGSHFGCHTRWRASGGFSFRNLTARTRLLLRRGPRSVGQPPLCGPLSAFGLVIHAHQPAQRVPPARQARAHCSNRNPEDLRRLLVGHSLKTHEQDQFALFFREKAKRMLKLVQLPRSRGIRRGDERRRHLFDANCRAFATGSAHDIDVLIVHQGKEPGADVSSGLPEMSLGDRPDEGLLHEIIRSDGVSSERSRIAAESGDLLFDEAMKF